MYHREYNNFVRPKSTDYTETKCKNSQNGEQVRRLYLEVVENVTTSCSKNNIHCKKTETKSNTGKRIQEINLSNHNLFLTVQNNDVTKLKQILNNSPDKINTLDNFGWTLLMIACQANSTDCVIELLNRGIDITIEDKAGNSARSLVIRNKNVTIASILLDKHQQISHDSQKNMQNSPVTEQYICSVCNNTVFPDRKEHLASTLHNITASKVKKIPPNYSIPETNKGFQLMLKGGWDKESGLGPNGSGNRYPIKPVLKNDKKGLGLKTKKNECDKGKNLSIKKTVINDYEKNRRMEIDFRREFY